MRTAKRTTFLLASILLCGTPSLTACSRRSDPPSPPVNGASTPALPPDPCAGIANLVKDHLNSPEVRSVVVQGQCTSLVVATTLGDNNNDTAQRLCDTAAEVAYSGDVNSVSVLAGSGKELAIGISGAKCLSD